MEEINKFISAENPLGQYQNWEDPKAKPGQDDDYDHNPGRPIILPVGKPIAVRLSSKDVIHDFFLPNFRVKLDALPGMYGRVYFTAIPQAQSTRQIKLSDPDLVTHAKGTPYRIWIDANTPGAIRSESNDASQVRYSINGRGADGTSAAPIVSGAALTPDAIASLRSAGIQEVTAITQIFELVCEELCGQGHYSMRGEVIFVSPEQYKAFSEKPTITDTTNKKPNIAGAATKPSVATAK